MERHQADRPVASRPSWWTNEHNSAWERTKAALQRDWEQTKADFSGASAGRDLNQDAGDTLRQARGKQAIPPEQVPNPPSERDLERHQRRAEKRDEQATKTSAKAREASAKGEERAPELARKASEARESAAQARADLERNRHLRWEDVEDAMRYGYGGSLHHRKPWDHSVEREMRTEWQALYPDSPWGDFRDHVQYGWEWDQGRVRP